MSIGFKIIAHHEDGFVYGYIELATETMKTKLNLGSMMGPISEKIYNSEFGILYVDFLEALRNHEKCKFVVFDNDVPMMWYFESNTDGYLTIKTENDDANLYEICIKMTNEIFAEMEKLVIKTKRKEKTPEATAEWEAKYFPKNYVYGRGLAYKN